MLLASSDTLASVHARCAGFSGSFWAAYHEVIPRAPGFEDRHQLYQLYHYLNHYNLFGSGKLTHLPMPRISEEVLECRMISQA